MKLKNLQKTRVLGNKELKVFHKVTEGNTKKLSKKLRKI